MLVTGAGSAPGVSALKALGGLGLDLLATAHDPYMPGLYMVDRSFVLPHWSDPQFVDALLEVVRREHIDVVVPVLDDELSVLGPHRDRFAPAVLAMAPQPALELCLDKWLLHERLRGHLPLPRTRRGPDAHLVEASARWVVKPRSGSAGEGVRVVDEQPGALGDDVIVQEHLPGPEVSVDVYVNRRGRTLATVPRMRLSTELGVSSCGRTFHDPRLEQLAARAARLVGVRGIANVQFREDGQGRPRLLEINPRIPGGMALTVAAGANLPALLVREALGEQVDRRLGFEDLAMVRFREEVFLHPDDLKQPRRPRSRLRHLRALPGPVKAGS